MTTVDTTDMKPKFDLGDATTAITSLSLTSLLVGDFLVIMNCKPDVIISEEPYISLMILVELKSGTYIRRIWNRTVATGKTITINQLVELCKQHFFHGKPCIGCPQDGTEEDDQEFLISQTPIPRKISRFCHEVLGSNANDEANACPECLKLSESGEETQIDVETKCKVEIKSEVEWYNSNMIESTFEDTTTESIIQSSELDDKDRHEPHDMAAETISQANKSLPSSEIDDKGWHEGLPPNSQTAWNDVEEVTSEVNDQHSPRSSPRKQCGKPTYGKMITEAIINSDKKMLPLSRIYAYITKEYHHFKMEDKGWQRSVRNNLIPNYQNNKFKKVPRNNGKGCLWVINGGPHDIRDADLVEDSFISKNDEISKDPDNIKCMWCEQEFLTKKLLFQHETKHHGRGKFVCPHCQTKSRFSHELVKHMELEGHGNDLDCPSCKKSISMCEFVTHYKFCTRFQTLCKTCGKKISKGGLEKHMKVHMRAEGVNVSEAYYHCDKCEKRYACPNMLNNHIRSVHDKIDYTCSECPMTFKHFYELTKHKNLSHSTDERYNCKHCGKRFGKVNHARLHERVHEDPQLQCRFCSKLFKNKVDLVSHERYHTGEKPFTCKVCNNGYTSKKALRQHEQFVHKMIGPSGGGSHFRRNKKEKDEPS